MDITEIKGIGPATAEKLAKFNIITLENLAMCTEEDLKEMLKIPRIDARNMISEAKEKALETAMTLKSLDDITEYRKNIMMHYSTHSMELDKILGGGVETTASTGLRGPFASGKTQMCVQVAISCIKAGRKVAWVEVEPGTFPAPRFYEIANAQGVKLNPKEDVFIITADIITDVEKQLLSYQLIQKKIDKGMDVGLIVIDSFTPKFKAKYQERESFPARSKMEVKHFDYLHFLASKYNLAILFSAQVMGVPDTDKANLVRMKEGDYTKVYGGSTIEHAATHWVSMIMTSAAKSEWKAIIIDSPYLPRAEAGFRITGAGIEDISRTRGTT